MLRRLSKEAWETLQQQVFGDGEDLRPVANLAGTGRSGAASFLPGNRAVPRMRGHAMPRCQGTKSTMILRGDCSQQ